MLGLSSGFTRFATMLALMLPACAPSQPDGAAEKEQAPMAKASSAETGRQLDAAITRDVPPGSTAVQVLAFLDAQNIEHSALIDQANQKHMGKDPNVKIISAIIRDTEKGALVSGNLAVTFRFDRDDRLIGHDVEQVNTGP